MVYPRVLFLLSFIIKEDSLKSVFECNAAMNLHPASPERMCLGLSPPGVAWGRGKGFRV